jgi:hypothetical protein
MNAPRQPTSHESQEHTPSQPRHDEDKKHAAESKPGKPDQQDRHDNDRQPSHKK